jgi:hypothetical protein
VERETEVEGWYLDPYGRHEQRWLSAGTPTALVRDGNAESHDPPPAADFDGPLVPAPTPAGDGSDLRRADAAQRDAGDGRSPADAALDASTYFPMG